ncbi:YbaB/EbfC family nucleoid-associated protein [Actinomadura litoris]|uniref:YbaB/EbfC family nucleoid-associated protein n=1 Tax=Actinomadura litoris TaxID=2678616 RepID=UPI001FA79B15|nr:YbaB/EbfC family nucleoid-associated protein [Actinomadura litoris]
MGATGFPEFDRELSKLTQQLNLAMDIPERVAAVKGEGESADRFVKVVVDSTGKLESLEINPRAMRGDSQTLTESITAAYTIAYDAMQKQIQEIIAPATEGSEMFAKTAEDRAAEAGLVDSPEEVARAISAAPDPVREMMAQLDKLKRLF